MPVFQPEYYKMGVNLFTTFNTYGAFFCYFFYRLYYSFFNNTLLPPSKHISNTSSDEEESDNSDKVPYVVTPPEYVLPHVTLRYAQPFRYFLIGQALEVK